MKRVINKDNLLKDKIYHGNIEAYEELYKMYYSRLVCFADTYLKNKTDAQDLTQDVFCNLWEKRKNIIHIKDIKSYLFVSVKNMSISKLRRNKYHNIELNDNINSDEDIVNSITETEVSKLLYDFINVLPPKCKRIMLESLDGKSNKEISEKFDIKMDTVRSQIRFGRERLREKFSSLNNLMLLVLSKLIKRF